MVWIFIGEWRGGSLRCVPRTVGMVERAVVARCGFMGALSPGGRGSFVLGSI